MKTVSFAFRILQIIFCVLLIVFFACKSDLNAEIEPEVDNPSDTLMTDQQAIVTQVETSGQDSSFQFKVTLKSPDTGCDQYANWWEVVSPEGELIYRRILAHSHVNEQPFTRSGGPVAVNMADSLIIRGHMDAAGYGTQAFAGSIADGFVSITTEPDFAKDLEEAQPQPNPCQF